MWIDNLELYPDTNSVIPQIKVRADINCSFWSELPVYVMGNLKMDGKLISRLEPTIESYNRNEEYSIPLTTKITSEKQRKFRVDLLSTLHERQVNFIENKRLAAPDKNVNFSVELEIHYLVVDEARAETNKYNVLKKKIEFISNSYSIEQSEWIRKYSSYLGLGKYLLVEFPVAENVEAVQGQHWQAVLGRAYDLLAEMENRLREGNWEEVIGRGRRLIEVFKIDKKQEEAKAELNALFAQSNFNDQDTESLRNSIFYLFEFLSKFLHEKGKSNGAETLPIRIPLRPQKEDAYFIYSMAAGLTNMIAVKAKKVTNE